MKSLVKDLVNRRVPHLVALYLGVSWGLVQFTDFMVEEFLLSPHWTRLVLAIVALLLPSVLLLAYFHGRKGRDEWARAEKIGVPINLVVALVVLILTFGGLDLGAATTTVVVETEEGDLVERVVPKTEFRKRTLSFPFDRGSGISKDESWISLLVPFATAMDLMDDAFFDPVPVDYFAEDLRKAGFADLVDVPLTLKLKISEDLRAARAFSGSIDRSGDDFVVTTQLHDVGRGSVIAENSYRGPDLLSLVDEISLDLRKNLEIPERDNVKDLPVVELMTKNQDALASFGRGLEAILVRTDWAEAAERLEAAAEQDPTFALAHLQRTSTLLLVNRPQEALASSQAAMNHLYRLPERFQFLVKSENYALNQQLEKSWSVIEMWAELYPDDLAALSLLAQVHQVRNQTELLIATLGRIYELNPAAAEVLQQIAEVHRQQGDFESARAALEEYVERFPEDHTGFSALAALARTTGDHELARENLDRAILLEPTDAGLLRSLAELELDVGSFGEARADLDRALEASKTAPERAATWAAIQSYHHLRGEMGAALEAMDRRLEETASFQAPALVLLSRLSDFEVIFDAGEREAALALFEEMEQQLRGPPFGVAVPVAEMMVAIGVEDAPRAAALVPRVREIAREQQILRGPSLGLEAELAELQQDWPTALGKYQESLELQPASLSLLLSIARCRRHMGDLSAAEKSIGEALRRRPAMPKALLELALVLEARGDSAGAVAQASMALTGWADADEDFAPAIEAGELLARLQARAPGGGRSSQQSRGG